MNLSGPVCTLVLAAVLTGCGATPEAASAPAEPNMTTGYVRTAREMGAVGLTDERLLAAGRLVCSKYGNLAKPGVAYSTRYAAYGDLFDQGLVPAAADVKVLHAILDATPFLCLNG